MARIVHGKLTLDKFELLLGVVNVRSSIRSTIWLSFHEARFVTRLSRLACKPTCQTYLSLVLLAVTDPLSFDYLSQQPVGARHAVPGCRGRSFGRRKINLSKVLAGHNVGVKKITDHIWLVSFMTYDLGFIDDECCRVECAPNPFGAKVLPMSPE